MSLEENKAIVRRYIEELWNKGNVRLAEEFIHRDLVNHLAPSASGPDGIRQSFITFRTAFPDVETKILHVIAEDDLVVVHWVSRGTLKGSIEGKGQVGRVAPTNKNATWTGTNIYRIADGKIAEIWANADELQQAYQLGLISRRPEAKAAPSGA